MKIACLLTLNNKDLYLFCRAQEGRDVQSSPTVCDLTDYTAHGILQARILEWVAFPFSRGKWRRNEAIPCCLCSESVPFTKTENQIIQIW